MKCIKLENKIRISELPLSLTSSEIHNDLKSCTPGEWALFQLKDENRYMLGFANPFAENSKILRLIKEVTPDLMKCENEILIRSTLEEFLDLACKKREFYKEMLGPCCRLFYGDQDGLPGLIIDKYCNAIVLQINTAGIDCYEKIISDYLTKHYQLPILYFENSLLRKIESLPSRPHPIEPLRVLEVSDNGVLIKIGIKELQKAGFYFDHSYNRLKLRHLLQDLKLSKLKVLDLFCYAGAWGFGLLMNGYAQHVHFVDQGDFGETLSETGAINAIAQNRFKFSREDVFRYFEHNTEKYDLIICDPPAFAKNSSKLPQAIEGYKKLFNQCLRRLNQNGILVAASCTYGIALEELSKLISVESRKLNCKISILDIGTQRIDHPLSSLSGSAFYLKYICYHIS